MESTQKPQPEASGEASVLNPLTIVPTTSRKRYEHLREIEVKMQEI
jgi:hypothetical protein